MNRYSGNNHNGNNADDGADRRVFMFEADVAPDAIERYMSNIRDLMNVRRGVI